MTEEVHESVHEKLQQISEGKGPEGKDPYTVEVTVQHHYMSNGAGSMDFMGSNIASFDDGEGIAGQVYAFPGGLAVSFKGDDPCDRWRLDIASLVTEISMQRAVLKAGVSDHVPGCDCKVCATSRITMKRQIRQLGQRLIDHA